MNDKKFSGLLRSIIVAVCWLGWGGLLSSPLAQAADLPSDRVIAFYYGWYGNPQTDGAYEHWNSDVILNGPKGKPKKYPGGDDIAANFYPQAGCYSVNDLETLDRQMRELVAARVGVIGASWWGEETFTGKNLKPLMDAAHAHGLKVCIHIEPFGGRNAITTGNAVRKLIDEYGSHPAFFRSKEAGNRPVFFVYDSYLTPATEWAELLKPGGKESIRGTTYDSAMVGLWVKEGDGTFMTEGGFDGFYTYFAADRFSFGSTAKNWPQMAAFAREHKLLFIPSVGPGYNDTRIRPWNGGTTRSRDEGRYYDRMFEAAIRCKPDLISITSYNEWHEGTQIEPAIPKKLSDYIYKDYSPREPDYYLKRTAYWVERFNSSR
jgi:glycoprotein endo-alpha-1,2-mannosidase